MFLYEIEMYPELQAGNGRHTVTEPKDVGIRSAKTAYFETA